MSNLENTIKGYLDKRAEEDPLFAESYKKPGKSIKECCDYITGQAYKLGGSTVEWMMTRYTAGQYTTMTRMV